MKFKSFEKKNIYAVLEGILVPEHNKKWNPNKSYAKKYQKHTACSYSYQLVCVDSKFSKPFKSYIGENAVYDLINSMIEEVIIVVLRWKIF